MPASSTTPRHWSLTKMVDRIASRSTALAVVAALVVALTPDGALALPPSEPAVVAAGVEATTGTSVPVDVEPVTGFDGADKVIAVVSVPAGGGTLSITNTAGLTREHGYAGWDKQASIGFSGTPAAVSDGLSSLRWNAPAAGGTHTLALSVTQAPAGTYYNPVNNHFYAIAGSSNTSWAQASAAATATEHFGLQGYLATITSAQENDFISAYTTAQNVWIGASDQAVEGQWRWVTGPEDGQQFWQGASGGHTVDGAYASWASGEPNNSSSVEHFAVTNWSGTKGMWNDLSGSHTVGNYLVEYGGIGTSTALYASDTADLTAVAPTVVVSTGTPSVAAGGSNDVSVELTRFDDIDGELVAVLSLPDGGGTVSVTGDISALAAEHGYPQGLAGSRIAFRGSAAAVTAALADQLKWTAPGTRGSFSLTVAVTQAARSGVYYGPEGHYYEPVVSSNSVTWTTARTGGANSSLFGMTGYLATITSQAENDFISQYTTAQNVWIGASDETVEGQWRWVTGPEAGQQFWEGVANGGRVSNRFASWASGEPNNHNNEDYAGTNYAGTQGLWNDFTNDNINVKSYLVEYGGMTGEISTIRQATGSHPLVAAEAPASPTGLVASAGDKKVTWSWIAPENDGGAPVTSYTVNDTAGNGGCTTTAPATSCTVIGLQNGKAYTFTVVATNLVGDSNAATFPTVAPLHASIGGQTEVLGAAPGGTTLVPIQVTMPANRNGKINIPPGRLSRTATGPKAVDVKLPQGLGGCLDVVTAKIPDGVTITLSGENGEPATNGTRATHALVTGPEYLVAKALDDGAVIWNPDCAAEPDAGTTTPSVDYEVTAATELTRPAPTTDPQTDELVPVEEVVIGHAGLDLTDNVEEISLNLGLNPEQGILTFDGTNIQNVSATPSDGGASLTLTGPENAIKTAIEGNRLVWHPATDVDTATLTAGIPDSTDMKFDPLHLSATVTVPNGTMEFVQDQQTYPTVESDISDDGHTLVLTAPVQDPTEVATAMADLKRALEEGITWTAPEQPGSFPMTVQLAGDGYSTTFGTVLKSLGPPSAPLAVTATRKGTTVTVRWEASTNTGSSPISSYEAKAGQHTCNPEDEELTCEITGVTGDVIDVVVVALNDDGRSLPGQTSITLPSAPTGVTATAGNAQAVVSWVAPAAPGDGPVEQLTVTAHPGGATCFALETTTSCTVPGLTNGVSYTFTVTARNSSGDSVPSLPSAAVRPAAPASGGGGGGGGGAPLPDPKPETPVPVRQPDGSLPRPGGGAGEILVDGKPAVIDLTRTRDSVTADGDGFSLTVTPTDNGGSPARSVLDGIVKVPSNGAVQVDATGFRPRSKVAVWLFSEPQLLGELDVLDDGVLANASLLLPPEALACRHTLQLVGTTAEGGEVAVSLGIQLMATPFPFSDTDPESTHAANIGCLASRQVVTGYGGSSYGPEQSLTRGQTASMLARMLRFDITGEPGFSDLVGNVHAGAIAAAADAGIVSGLPDGTFRSGRPLARGQLASMVARAAGLTPVATGTFVDVDDNVHAGMINAAAAAGLVEGFSDGTFAPERPITRAQAATMMVRLVDELEEH